jgi:hypothetical protein
LKKNRRWRAREPAGAAGCSADGVVLCAYVVTTTRRRRLIDDIFWPSVEVDRARITANDNRPRRHYISSLRRSRVLFYQF